METCIVKLTRELNMKIYAKREEFANKGDYKKYLKNLKKIERGKAEYRKSISSVKS